MLRELQAIKDNPEDVPELTPMQRSMLQARFNAGWQISIGTVDYLKSKGHSEEYILGFLSGLNEASAMLDNFEFIKQQLREEEE